MKLTKKQFVKCLTDYKKMMEDEANMMEALNVGPEWFPSAWIEKYYQLFSDMCEMHEDDTYGTTLDWYCYDCDFGKNDNLNYIIEKNEDGGSKVTKIINTPEKLYDLICKENK